MTAMMALLDTLDPASRGAAHEAIKAQQLLLIDRLVRAARAEGWCGEFERSMATIFPDGHPETGSTDAGAWVDSDGFTCRGLDREGYSPDGFHAMTGLDREGYNRQGLDADGYDRNGFDRYGRDRDGYGADGFNVEGINREGLDPNGFPTDAPEHQDWLYRFDRDGYDADGFNRDGNHRQTGLNRYEHARRFRYNSQGYERPRS